MTEPLLPAVHTFLEGHLDDFMRDLAALVNVDCGSHNREGINAVGALLETRAREWGWEAERYPGGTAGDCWRYTCRGRGAARLLLLGHLDTVYPDGTAAERPLRVEGNRAYGPGVSDMKSGVLAGLWALRALQLQAFDDFAELSLFCDSDEEVGSPVGVAIYRPLLRDVHAGLVLESARANGNIVSARKGGSVYTLRVHGRAAHAGVEPEKGANAVVELAHQILAAAALNGLQPGVTVNVDLVHGGTKVNVIPALAEAQVDVRACDPQGMQAVDEAFERLPQRVSVPGTQVELLCERHAPPMPKTEGNALLVELAQAAARELGFEVADAPITGGMSDANFVALAGVPVLDGLGPIGGDDHSPREYLLLDSIVPRTALLAGLIVRSCASVTRLQALRGRPA